MRNLAFLALLAVFGSALTFVTACAGGSVVPTPVRTGSRHGLAGSPASIVIPTGLRKLDHRTWARFEGGQAVVILRFAIKPEVDATLDGHVDDVVAALGRDGTWGVTRDERVDLADLEARLIEALELFGESRRALWQIVTVAETGLYTVSLIGLASALEAHRAVYEGALRSLRVEAGHPDDRR